MPPNRCPHCNMVLTSSELAAGKCGCCDKSFVAKSSSSTPSYGGSPNRSSTPQGLNSTNKPSSNSKVNSVTSFVATTLFLLFLTSTAIPYFGLIHSCWIGIGKNQGSVCCKSGCALAAVEHEKYSKGIIKGYCKDHAPLKTSSIGFKTITVSSNERKFPYALVILAIMFVGFYGSMYWKVVNPSPLQAKKPLSLSMFALLSLGGIFGVNLFFWFASRYMC